MEASAFLLCKYRFCNYARALSLAATKSSGVITACPVGTWIIGGDDDPSSGRRSVDILIVADIKGGVVGTGLDPHEDISFLQSGKRLPVGRETGNLSAGGFADIDTGGGKVDITQKAGTVGISRHIASGLAVQIA